MTPNIDERREVAERLRMCARETNGTYDFTMYLSHWVGFDGVTDDKGNSFTIQANRREAELTLEKLADLIDPTCHLVSTTFHSCSDGSAAFYHELSCGHTCETVWAKPPSYCTECGARVVNDDD